MEQTIQVCYAIHDSDGSYAKFIGTSMDSILENTTAPVAFHILHDDTLTALNREKFQQLVDYYGATVAFYDLPALQGTFLDRAYALLADVWLSYYSKAVLYRFFVWQVLPREVQRAIYFDADILLNMDIRQLWREPTGPCGLAAVVDIAVQHNPERYNLIRDGFFDAGRYFNSGVLLMDREAFTGNETWIQETLHFFQQYPAADFPDQDVMNYFFGKDYRQLPYTYNQLVEWERLQQHGLTAGIYHFSGHVLNLDLDDCFTQRFFHYFMKTPWADEHFLNRFYGLVRSTYDSRTRDLQQLGNLLVQRKRVLIYEQSFAPQIDKAFRLQPEEEAIPCEDILGNVAAFTEAAVGLKNTHTMLIFSQHYPQIAQAMAKAGLQQGRHFLDGRIFLFWGAGGYSLDEYEAFRRL